MPSPLATPRAITVAEVAGERMRFHVESWTRPTRPHLVDLLAHGGIGECSCADWQSRRWPLIRDGLPGQNRCRHVNAARAHFLDNLLLAMAATHDAE
jgi:hypothetical protein